MITPAAILVAARDEGERIAETVAALRAQFPHAEVVVADDGSRDDTAAQAEAAGARVLRLPRLGKGEALTAAEREAPPGALLLVDADLHGELGALLEGEGDLRIAAFSRRVGGGFGLAKGVAGQLVRIGTGRHLCEPLSGQRLLSEHARQVCFPLARGFGCELRMTVDALRAGLDVCERPLALAHRPTGRDLGGFLHRGRQLVEAVLAAGPLAVNYRGFRLPLLGALVALGGVGAPRRTALAVGGVAALGLADDLWSGPQRGFRAHLRAGSTTGTAKLLGVPALALYATGSLSGAAAVGLAANALNQLDTGPGRALKAYLLGYALLRPPGLGGYAGCAILLLPYDLRERGMLGDAGSNALGAVLGLGLVARLPRVARLGAIAALGGLNLLGDRRSLGELIERSPLLGLLDRLGRVR